MRFGTVSINSVTIVDVSDTIVNFKFQVKLVRAIAISKVLQKEEKLKLTLTAHILEMAGCLN